MNLIHSAASYLAERTAARGVRRNPALLASDLLPLSDLACLLLAALLAHLLARYGLVSRELSAGASDAFTPIPWVAIGLAPFILYDPHFGSRAGRSLVPLLVSSHAPRLAVLVGVVLIFGAFSHALDGIAAGWLIAWFGSSVLLTSLARTWVISGLRRRPPATELIAVVGGGPVADKLVRNLSQAAPDGVELLGVFDERAAPRDSHAGMQAGTLAQLVELGKTRRIDWILLTLPAAAATPLRPMMGLLRAMAVPIGLCAPNDDLALPHQGLARVGENVAVSLLADRPLTRSDATFKAVEDFVLGALITLLLAPVLLLIALAIKLDSPGPVLFRQRRHAVNNAEFDIYKFRTMRWAPSGATPGLEQTTRNDARITRIGRFLRASSLDELPQLFNVLAGDMSLVGPRPHAVNMRTEDCLGAEITDTYAHRHRVKPGITGWAQVNGARGATATTAQLRRRVELDLHYIENWSFWLDLKILAMTLRVVLQRTNAF